MSAEGQLSSASPWPERWKGLSKSADLALAAEESGWIELGHRSEGRKAPQEQSKRSKAKAGAGRRESEGIRRGLALLLDRFIRQVLLEVVRPLLDPTFSDTRLRLSA